MHRRLSLTLALAVATMAASCEGFLGPGPGGPEKVTDLRVGGVTTTSVQLQWTEVDNGDGAPSDYVVAFGTPTVSLPVAVESAIQVVGSSVGEETAVVVEGLIRNTSYEFIVIGYRGELDSIPTFGEPSGSVTATTDADAPGDIALVSAPLVGSSTATIQWTQVDDGAGQPANYAVLVGSPTVTWTGDLSGAVAVAGTQIGSIVSFGLSSLTPTTGYQVIVAALRGEIGASPVVGAPSDALAFTTTSVSATAPFFSDGFDSGAKTNANGFTWSSAGRVDVSNTNAFEGAYSLRFRFGPDTVGGDSSAEQRFNLGRYLSEYWVDYMLFVPTNFVHRNDSPNNNKFFMTWRDTYSDATGGTWRIGYEYQSTSSTLRPMSSRWDLNSWTSSGLNHPAFGQPLFGGSGPVILGQWNRIRLHFKAASSRTASDGMMGIWVNDVLVGELTTGKFHNFFDTPADAVLRNGYFMGWANSGFTELTYIFIDNVKFYDTNPGW